MLDENLSVVPKLIEDNLWLQGRFAQQHNTDTHIFFHHLHVFSGLSGQKVFVFVCVWMAAHTSVYLY